MTKDANTPVFVAGYEKGRADGLAQAITLLQLAIDYFPHMVSNGARVIVPDKEATTICNLVDGFGQHTYRNGIRDEKKKAAAKATAKHQLDEALENEDLPGRVRP